ncbi:MAG: glutamylcysteine synthetase [Lachnospiraceae bacterium]|nr:glutamylcysteine synthetase [Lachnospiraceae bacterium]
MHNTDIDEAIYNKYIKPTKRRRRDYAGLEFELPIVNLKKQPVDFSVVHKLTDAFIKQFNFENVKLDSNGDIYSAHLGINGDDLSYDCSYNTLELSLGVESSLNVLHERFLDYYTFIQDFFKPYNHMLTGMGINPYHTLNINEPIPVGRYRMLFNYLSSYKRYDGIMPFHSNPNFGMFSCASQIQLDVEEAAVPEVINTFTKLEPLKAILFANSLWGSNNELLCSRDYFWKNSMHGINTHNVDLYDVEFDSPEDIISYIKTMSIYCVERGDKYINFYPVPLEKYFKSDKITGEYFDGEKYREITFKPEIEDLKYLRSFKFEDLTFRGTIEFRSVCEQPVSEIMAPAALHAGLIENIHELTERLENDRIIYHNGYNVRELRAIFCGRSFPEFIDKKELSKLMTDIISIAEQGLKKRGRDEEKHLSRLYERAESLTSPARQMADGLDAGLPVEYFIDKYARVV